MPDQELSLLTAKLWVELMEKEHGLDMSYERRIIALAEPTNKEKKV